MSQNKWELSGSVRKCYLPVRPAPGTVLSLHRLGEIMLLSGFHMTERQKGANAEYTHAEDSTSILLSVPREWG